MSKIILENSAGEPEGVIDFGVIVARAHALSGDVLAAALEARDLNRVEPAVKARLAGLGAAEQLLTVLAVVQDLAGAIRALGDEIREHRP